MTVWNFVQYSLIILSGLLSACVTAILYVELRWNLNPLTLVVPWLAVSGLILAVAVRARQKPWPFIPAIAALLCSIQLYRSQTFWTNREFQRMQNTHQITEGLNTFYMARIEENDPDGYDESEGGMKSLPHLGKKGYVPFLSNLGLWALAVFGSCIAARKHNANICNWRNRKPAVPL